MLHPTVTRIAEIREKPLPNRVEIALVTMKGIANP